MDREIKFRGWNKDKMIYYPSWFTLDKNRVLCFGEQPHNYVDDSDVDYPERIILMQYIGIKDGEGKEIYEGDIVKFQANYTSAERLGWKNGVIEYEGDGYVLRVDGEEESYSIYGETDEFYYKSEVIGNIYEKKENGK